MDFSDFQKFIDYQDNFFRKAKNTNKDEKERILVRTIKLGEEFGELCDAILSSMGDQRKNKLLVSKKGDLEGEFADVMITTFLLAKASKIDLMSAVSKKIKKILKKHNKQIL